MERHLIDNDVVLFNRQPSLHKLSIMAHYVSKMFAEALKLVFAAGASQFILQLAPSEQDNLARCEKSTVMELNKRSCAS